MPVRHYEWGVENDSNSSGGGSAVQVNGPAEVFTGTAGAAATTHNFSDSTIEVTILNIDDTGILEYSLDAGVSWIPLEPYGNVFHDVAINSIQIRRQGAVDADYRIVAALSS